MAGHTIGTKSGLLVVRIAGLGIVGLVTTHTRIWRIVITTIMAGGTIIGYACMRTVKCIIVVVVRELSGAPPWDRRMTSRTICTES